MIEILEYELKESCPFCRYKQNCKELLDKTKLKAIKRWEERV